MQPNLLETCSHLLTSWNALPTTRGSLGVVTQLYSTPFGLGVPYGMWTQLEFHKQNFSLNGISSNCESTNKDLTNASDL